MALAVHVYIAQGGACGRPSLGPYQQAHQLDSELASESAVNLNLRVGPATIWGSQVVLSYQFEPKAQGSALAARRTGSSASSSTPQAI